MTTLGEKWQFALSHVQAKAGQATDIAATKLGAGIIGARYYADITRSKVIRAGEIVRREAGETVIGLGYMPTLVGAKARETVTSVKTGISSVAAKAGESFGNVTSFKWKLLLPLFIVLFIVILISIGYSGLGAPAARVAEREYVHRR